MVELDDVVENPIKQPIKPSPPIFVHFLQICGPIACKIWSNCSGPIRVISLNPRVSCIFSYFIVINIPCSFCFFIHSRVFPRSEPLSSSKRSKIKIATAALSLRTSDILFGVSRSFLNYVGQRFATCPAMLDIFRKKCWTTRPTMFDSLAKP